MKKVILLDIFASTISLTSIAFMALVFYAEIFGGFGRIPVVNWQTGEREVTNAITFVEPVLWMKVLEFGVILAGFISTGYLFVRRLFER